MIEHVWSVVCSKSIIDGESNNISLLEVIEQVNVPAPPHVNLEVPPPADPSEAKAAIAIPFELVTLWTRAFDGEASQGKGRIATIGVSGNRKEFPPFDINLMANDRIRTRARFMGLEYRQPGRMSFIVELKNDGEDTWKSVATIPLVIGFGRPHATNSN
jgi:hypothetical protein